MAQRKDKPEEAAQRAAIRASQAAKGLRLVEDTRARVELPDQERGRSPDEVRRLDILNRRIAKPLPRGDKRAEREREENIRERDALEHRPHLAADARWSKAAQDETAALAAGRGEAVDVDRSGVRRILDRDPLLSLARAGHLTPEQLETGAHVRELYDGRAQDAGAMEYTGMPGRAHDNDRFVKAHLVRAKASEMLGRIERAVAVHLSAEPAALVMLRVVCERGMSASSQGEGRAVARNCQALARALDIAADVLSHKL